MILHADLNSFFARVEQQANPRLRNRPIGILGKGHKGARTCVCAASPEAKVFGVKSGFSTWEARRLCPSILLVPPDYPKYLDISRRFIAILSSISPAVEIFSIDEAFLEVSGGVDKAVAAATAIKKTMQQELGELVTASIGIAWGKVFAKLAGELKKPDGLIILERDTWLGTVGHLSVSELCGIGRRLSMHLAEMGISTIAELTTVDAGVFVSRFGRSAGMRLWHIGQGIDLSPVNPFQHLAPPKSIGHQITLDQPRRFDHVSSIITKLALKVARRLRRSGQSGTTIGLQLSLANHVYIHRVLKRKPGIMTDQEFLRAITELYQQVPLPGAAQIERVGVVTYGLEISLHQPLPLFTRAVDNAQLTTSLDILRDRYGDNVISWANAYGIDFGNIRDWRGPHAVLER